LVPKGQKRECGSKKAKYLESFFRVFFSRKFFSRVGKPWARFPRIFWVGFLLGISFSKDYRLLCPPRQMQKERNLELLKRIIPTQIAHSPRSNRLLGCERLDLSSVVDLKIPFTLATDGLSSNYSLIYLMS